MKFLCLAYGDEAGWHALSDAQRRGALARDAAIRDRGALMSAVRPEVTTVRTPDGDPNGPPYTTAGPAGETGGGTGGPAGPPLAGFAVIEADSLEEVVALVSGTPCAIGGGRIEVRPFWDLGEGAA